MARIGDGDPALIVLEDPTGSTPTRSIR